ncbi:MAG TPA: hypothetical protein VK633_15300 [Verrucomicrobiae bacterium]|nr:hypothetical protein [Verrucomicrobiae bacterium]
MSASWQEKIAFLESFDAGAKAHTNGALLQHLIGTHDLLKKWQCRTVVCEAGLFHSIYGTERFEEATVPLTERHVVRELIGEEAEYLAWLFCLADSESFNENLTRIGGFRVRERTEGETIHLSNEEWRDLSLLTFANAFEAIPRVGWRVRRNIRSYLDRLDHFVPPSAQQALHGVLPPWWQFWK